MSSHDPQSPQPDRPPSPTQSSPFHDLLGLGPIQSADGRSRIEIVVEERHLRSLGIAHGGLLASLLDSVLGMAAASRAPAHHYTVTVQLNCNFIRPAWKGETLIATGEALHVGRQTAVTRAEVRNAQGILVASGTATCMFQPHPGGSRGLIERRDDRSPA